MAGGDDEEMGEREGEWAAAWQTLLWTFAASGTYTLVASQFPALRSFAVLFCSKYIYVYVYIFLNIYIYM